MVDGTQKWTLLKMNMQGAYDSHEWQVCLKGRNTKTNLSMRWSIWNRNMDEKIEVTKIVQENLKILNKQRLI